MECTKSSFSYQWVRNDGTSDADIGGATGGSYTLVDTDEGQAVKVRVSFTDDRGHHETLTSAATGAVAAAPSPLTASFHDVPPSHDGSATFTFELRFGEEPADGFSYKTLRDHALAVTGGEVASVGRKEPPGNIRWEITVQPSGNGDVAVSLPATTDCDDEGSICADDGRILSTPVELTVPGPGSQDGTTNTPATGAPMIGGIAQVGQTLTAGTSGIGDVDGTANATFSYQWLADDAETSGATGASYTLADADEGKAIKVRVSFTDDAGNGESLTSAATEAVAARPNTPATGAPTVSGTLQVGETLTADPSGIADADGTANATFAYLWLAGDSDISGATGSSYTLVDADVGKAIKVKVSFTDDGGNEESLTSTATEIVAARPNTPATGARTVSGAAQVGETLAADTSGIRDADGLTGASFSYQWVRNDGTSDADISGATGGSYTLVDTDEGQTVKVRVSFTDDRGHQESLTSAATGAVAAAPSPLTASIHGAPQSHDGNSTFTFELRLSETPADGFSYKTLRDHSFTVTGGEVTKAKRKEPPGNLRWEITVQPSGSGDVTVVLPVTEDCESDGAICTEDGRMLSNRVEVTVSGSGG